MPKREEPLIKNETYHVYNKTIDGKVVFNNDSFCRRFVNLIYYYRSHGTPMSYSHFKKLDKETQLKIKKSLSNSKLFKIELLSYVLMPNHFHLLLKQKVNFGISSF